MVLIGSHKKNLQLAKKRNKLRRRLSLVSLSLFTQQYIFRAGPNRHLLVDHGLNGLM